MSYLSKHWCVCKRIPVTLVYRTQSICWLQGMEAEMCFCLKAPTTFIGLFNFVPVTCTDSRKTMHIMLVSHGNRFFFSHCGQNHSIFPGSNFEYCYVKNTVLLTHLHVHNSTKCPRSLTVPETGGRAWTTGGSQA